jgi:hypothetical protein
LVLGSVVIDRESAVLDEPLQRGPPIRKIAQAVADR